MISKAAKFNNDAAAYNEFYGTKGSITKKVRPAPKVYINENAEVPEAIPHTDKSLIYSALDTKRQADKRALNAKLTDYQRRLQA